MYHLSTRRGFGALHDPDWTRRREKRAWYPRRHASKGVRWLHWSLVGKGYEHYAQPQPNYGHDQPQGSAFTALVSGFP